MLTTMDSEGKMPSPPARKVSLLAMFLVIMSISANALLLAICYEVYSDKDDARKLDTLLARQLLQECQVNRALLLIDVQNCFMPDSTSLPVGGAGNIVPVLNEVLTQKSAFFHTIIRTQDFHNRQHISFASTVGAPPFSSIDVYCTDQVSPAGCCPHLASMDFTSASSAAAQSATDATNNPSCGVCFPDRTATAQGAPALGNCTKLEQSMWPDHCVDPADGGDGGFPTSVVAKPTDFVIQKGTDKWIDAYSAFYDNGKFRKTTLDTLLREHGVTEVYIAGLATDFCVSWSAMDAVSLNYKTFVLEDAVAGIGLPLSTAALTPNKTTVHLEEERLRAAGVKLISSKILPADTEYSCHLNDVPEDKPGLYYPSA